MKIAVFTPFGTQSQESGLIYLLANYLKSAGADAAQLRCNGVFSTCDRDADNQWRRPFQGCFQCIADQSSVAQWSALDVQELSRFVMPEEIEETKRLLLTTPVGELMSLEIRGIRLWDTIVGSFLNRFGITTPDSGNRQHEQALRRFMLGGARMLLATRRFNNLCSPDLLLVAGGNDFLSAGLVAQSKEQRRSVALLQWAIHERHVRILHPREKKELTCELFLEGIARMRADVKTWPTELITIIEDILTFLEVPSTQIALPLAQ